MLPPNRTDFAHLARGFLMGSADIVPGVSGGTVALIVGIYQRLVAAISHFDARLLAMLARREWKTAAEHIDLRFLIALGAGIMIGIASLASLMQYLLLNQRPYTLAAFFGLILASSIIVAKMIRPRDEKQAGLCLLVGAVAACFAFWVVGLQQLNQPPQNLAYFFFSGMVAICAMILPGISGAFILLMLGMYEPVTDVIKGCVYLDVTLQEILQLAVFAAGCACGLIGFAKLLRMLLERAYTVTMAALCGFMLGSLRKMWPFQQPIDPEVMELKHRQYVNVRPEDVAQVVAQFLVPALIALTLVLGMEWWATRRANAALDAA